MHSRFLKLDKFVPGLIIFLLSFTAARAVVPVVHISPKPAWLSVCKPYDKKPSLRTVEDGYFFELAEHQVQVEKQQNYHHIIREIVSETGIQDGSEISVSFDPTFERLNFHEITVWRDNKPQNRLKASAFKIIADEKDLSNFIYQGTYSALCILDDIRKGDRIEYSYTITGRNPIFNNKFSDDFYLQWRETVAHEYTALIFSTQRKMSIKSFNGAEKPGISEANGLKRYVWESFQIKPALYDENEPGWFDARAHVQASDYDSWAEVTNWALTINPVKTSITGELATEVAKLKAISGNDKEKYFRNAVKTVQDEVRYMGIEIGQYSHKANNPEKVFSQRYGDCKDKSLLLVSMLRAGGIDANMVLVNSEGGDIGQYIPAHDVFDHAVVVAQLNGKQVWVDATISYQRGEGTDIYFPNYGKGLVLKPGNTGLTTIPASKAGKIVCDENFTVKNARSPVKLEVITTYTLSEADKIRDRLASSGMAETEKNYLKYYSKTYNKVEPDDSIVVKDDEQKNVLTTIEKYHINDFFKKDSTEDNYYVSFYADYIRQELPEITNQTKTPVAVTYPFNEDYTIHLYLPSGWDIPAAHDAISRDAYSFSSDYSAVGDTLTLNYKFSYLKGVIPVDKLDEVKQDIKELTDHALSYTVSYTPNGENPAPSDLNQWMLNLVLLVVLLMGTAGVFIYRRETPGIVFSYGSTFTPLGGWLILVGIGLFLTPLIIVFNLFNSAHFSMAAWNRYGTLAYGASLKSQLVFETACDIILAGYAVFCLVLFFNRRDILPRFIIGYYLYALAFCTADYFFASSVSHHQLPDSYLKAVIQSLVLAAIWVPYFLRSSRVQETFIVPYPSYNYTYESPNSNKGELPG